MEKQKRKFERFSAAKLEIECNLCGQDKSSIRDISIGGAGVCSERSLEVGSRCMLAVRTARGSVEIPAEVVWSNGQQRSLCKDSGLPVSMGLCFDKGSIESTKDLVFELLNSN